MKTTKQKTEDIERIIYWFTRYQGIHHKDTLGKFYSFSDLALLERRIKAYLKRPSKFNFDHPEMDIEY